MDTRKIAENIAEWLTSEGYRPTIDEDFLVRFKKEGRTYLVVLDEDDPQYYRIVFPNFWKIESDEERGRVAEACLHTSAKTKVAKFELDEECTTGSIELFCSSIDEFLRVFSRSMSALETGVGSFVKRMRESRE